MKKRLVTWLKKLSMPDVLNSSLALFGRMLSGAVRPALAEDMRKVGVTAIGIGLVGVLVNGTHITRADALYVLLFGAIIWVTGLWLTSLKTEDKE